MDVGHPIARAGRDPGLAVPSHPEARVPERDAAELAVGVVAYPGVERNDLVLWVPAARAIVLGDTLIDRGDGLEVWIQSWNTEVTAVRSGGTSSSACSRRVPERRVLARA